MLHYFKTLLKCVALMGYWALWMKNTIKFWKIYHKYFVDIKNIYET